MNRLPLPLVLSLQTKLRMKSLLVFTAFVALQLWQPVRVTAQQSHPINNQNKMKIEVWSDVVCPFCYIGKKKFETALAQFDDRANVHLVWKSFQLDPNIKTDPTITVYDRLSTSKGIPVQQAKEMAAHATKVAAEVGITMDFDRAVVANSKNAHRLMHFGKEKGLQNEVKELLFKAYFTDGKNIDDSATLTALAVAAGLPEEETKDVLSSTKYADAVHADMVESQQLGVRGVPFFVFDRKYAVSGAQDPQAFLETLKKSFSEWKKANPTVKLQVTQGPNCSVDKPVCD